VAANTVLEILDTFLTVFALNFGWSIVLPGRLLALSLPGLKAKPPLCQMLIIKAKAIINIKRKPTGDRSGCNRFIDHEA
jgi:hypothetical protein